jgi:DMSO/TMAO reductase YedYZ molybdopterin-dependent catalytic subunit
MRNDDWKNEAIYDQDRLDRYVWAQSKQSGMTRRRCLQILAVGLGAGAAGYMPCFQCQARAGDGCVDKPTPPEWFFNRGGANFEMRFDTLDHRDYLIPNERFFIRSHACTPRIAVDTWRLQVFGTGVEQDIELTYGDVLNLEPVSVQRFVECAGNGRSFYDTQQGRMAQGAQWLLGAIGVAEWTGVRLRDVLELAGLKNSAVDVMPAGLDDEIGMMGHVRRPFPIEKALEDDTLLVYGMNGETLLLDHGFPARVLVPGWIGVASIKWVGSIEVSDQPLMSPFNTQLYRLFGDDYPPEGELLTLQNVKSAFELPFSAQLRRGRHILHGRSWSGNGRIERVDVSFDGSRYHRAELHGPNLPQAWVRWAIEWEARPGDHMLRARATDETGETQPDEVPFNTFGYTFGAIVRHPVTVR